MTTTYEHSTTTTSSAEIGLDRGYLTSWKGILKIVECVLDLIAFICASVEIVFSYYGGGWVQFVTMSAFITTLLLYLFHLFRVIYKLPGPWGLIELIYYFVYSLMLLIAAIVCATRAHWHGSIAAATELIYYAFYALMMLIAAIVCAANGGRRGAIAAAAFFTFAATVAYILDTFFLFRAWQQGRSSAGGAGTTTTTTTTTTTHETYETRTQY